MKLMEFYKSIDAKLLKSKPKLWVWGAHIFIPLVLAALLIPYGAGWLFDIEPLPDVDDLSSVCDKIGVFMIAVVLLLGVLFYIRQIRFNALRVHHFLPYKNPFQHYVVFALALILITATPHTFTLGVNHKLNFHLNEAQYMKDLKVMNRGYTHFVEDDAYENWFYKTRDYKWDSEAKRTYKLDEATGKLIVYRYKLRSMPTPSSFRESEDFVDHDILEEPMEYPENYDKNIMWDTITRAEAEEEIKAFLSVSTKYGGEVMAKFSNPQDMIDSHLLRNEYNFGVKSPDREYFDALIDKHRLQEVSELYNEVIQPSYQFNEVTLDYWKGYIFFGLALASLLFVITATKRADFGWGMLVFVLTLILFFVVTEVFLDGLVRWRYKFGVGLFSFIGIYLAVLLWKGRFRKVKKAFAVAAHLYVPMVVAFIYEAFDNFHHCPYDGYNRQEMCSGYEYFTSEVYDNMIYYSVLLSFFVAIWVFNRFYTRKYVHPA